MIRITNFSVPFTDQTPLSLLIAKRLQLPPQAVLEVVIVRKAIDARRYRKAPIQFVYVIDVKVDGLEKKILAHLHKDKNIAQVLVTEKTVNHSIAIEKDSRPIVVGFGPAGMFAALTLAKRGYAPLILERGHDVDRRHDDIEKFWRTGMLDERSNVQFGEGGAGTFSDGKLTTRINDSKMMDVLEAFVAAGAPAEIKYLHKPHIGTDLLRTIVKNIRKEIIRMGGEVRFASSVTDIEIERGAVTALIVNDEERIACHTVLLGIGHSARDTYAMLHAKKVSMQAKAFAIGVRIEHPQKFINAVQYGEDAENQRLPVADYALTYQDRMTGRGAYSFCMCPGGQVVAATSEVGGVVTNGMSNYHRDSKIANAALLVTVSPQDFGTEVLAGIEFQRKYETRAFQCAGRNYYAPVQTVGDFLSGRSGSTNFLTMPTYRPGITAVDLHDCLPKAVTDTLALALQHFDHKIKGFADESAAMTGIETRSSAPCRILRSSNYVSENTLGLYPMGEGAGYAGGIMSAAIDGINTALAFIQQYEA